MNKIVIVNIPMTVLPQVTVYTSNDGAVPAGNIECTYPVSSFLQATLQSNDTVLFLMLIKKSKYSKWEARTEEFKKEIDEFNKGIKADISYKIIESEFSENKYTHEELFYDIIQNIPDKSHIIADITYGPKDLPFVIFAVLNFSEKYLDCEIDNIIYGRGVFDDNGKITETQLCDISPLYSLHSLVNSLNCDNPVMARELIRKITRIGKE